MIRVRRPPWAHCASLLSNTTGTPFLYGSKASEELFSQLESKGPLVSVTCDESRSVSLEYDFVVQVNSSHRQLRLGLYTHFWSSPSELAQNVPKHPLGCLDPQNVSGQRRHSLHTL